MAIPAENKGIDWQTSLKPLFEPKCDFPALANRPPAPKGSRRAESSDDYPDVVAILNERWRVIGCRHGIQWVLQGRNRAERVARDGWRGRSFCHTKEALIRVCDAHAGLIDPDGRAILAGLPERFPETQSAPERTSDSVSPPAPDTS